MYSTPSDPQTGLYCRMQELQVSVVVVVEVVSVCVLPVVVRTVFETVVAVLVVSVAFVVISDGSRLHRYWRS